MIERISLRNDPEQRTDWLGEGMDGCVCSMRRGGGVESGGVLYEDERVRC